MKKMYVGNLPFSSSEEYWRAVPAIRAAEPARHHYVQAQPGKVVGCPRTEGCLWCLLATDCAAGGSVRGSFCASPVPLGLEKRYREAGCQYHVVAPYRALPVDPALRLPSTAGSCVFEAEQGKEPRAGSQAPGATRFRSEESFYNHLLCSARAIAGRFCLCHWR